MIKNKLFNWIGGKKWLSKELNETFNLYSNKDIKIYAEPFAGGLGSFFYTLETIQQLGVETIYLNDINNTIISTYKHIKENYTEVYRLYSIIEEDYKKTVPEKTLTLHKKKDKIEIKELLQDSCLFYNNIKKEFNKIKDSNSIESVAHFLFLAEHCFNSVYRENKKGEFNTPYNWEAGLPNLENKLETFELYSSIFNQYNIHFFNMDCFSFLAMLEKQQSEILVYCDPPYLNETISENKYNKNHFGKPQQIQLLEVYKKFDFISFSNHYYPIFENFCTENNFEYQKHFRNNIMSAKSSNRGDKVPEILAYKK